MPTTMRPNQNLRLSNFPNSNQPPPCISPTASTTSTSSSSKITVTLSRPSNKFTRGHPASSAPNYYGAPSANMMSLSGLSDHPWATASQSTNSHSQSHSVKSSTAKTTGSTSIQTDASDTGESVVSNHIPVPTLSLPSRDEIRAVEKKLDELTKKLEMELEVSAKSNSPVGCCAYCTKPIMKKEEGCRANGQCYHVECFKCSICQRRLTGQVFYEVEDDGHPHSQFPQNPSHGHGHSNPQKSNPPRMLFCEEDYNFSGFRIGVDICSLCEQPIMATENEPILKFVETLDRKFHVGCFTCTICGVSLAGRDYTIDDKYNVVCSPTNNATLIDNNNNPVPSTTHNMNDINSNNYKPNCLEIALGIEKQAGNLKFNPVSKHGLVPLKRSSSGSNNLNKQNIVKYTWGSGKG